MGDGRGGRRREGGLAEGEGRGGGGTKREGGESRAGEGRRMGGRGVGGDASASPFKKVWGGKGGVSRLWNGDGEGREWFLRMWMEGLGGGGKS